MGCAIIDVDKDGATRVISSEMGHVEFSPADSTEVTLANAVRGTSAVASWEQMLLLDRTHPAAQGIGQIDWSRRMGAMLGRFTGNAILANAAWDGAMLTGQGAARLLMGCGTEAFKDSFLRQRALRRHMVDAPCWRIEQQHPVLTGGAALLAERRAYMLNG